MTDKDLEGLVSKLKSNENVLDLVKCMKPRSIIAVVSKKLDLQPKEAARVTKNLLQHLHYVHYEGLAGPGIETNKKYPVPASLRKHDVSAFEEEELEEYTNFMPKFPIMRYHFPPDPVDEPEGWPYDKMSKAMMDPKNKYRKRPIMSSKNPFHQDLRTRQPGGDGGKGIYTKGGPHSRDNSTSASSRSWDKKGTPGWSSSPPGEEFDLPTDEQTPVGVAVPLFKYGTSVGRRMGFRRK